MVRRRVYSTDRPAGRTRDQSRHAVQRVARAFRRYVISRLRGSQSAPSSGNMPHCTVIAASPAAGTRTHARTAVYLSSTDARCVARWRNGRVLDLRSGGRGFDSRVGAQLRNDCGQVAHTHLRRRRQSTLLYVAVILGTFTFTQLKTHLFRHHTLPVAVVHCSVVPRCSE